MKRVGAPAVSPDGRWVVFPVTEPAYDEKKEVADLWIVPADGSAKPRRLTSGKGGESGARLEPGQPRASRSRPSARTTRSRRSTCSTSRAAARRAASPSSPLAARGPVWSPDGTCDRCSERASSRARRTTRRKEDRGRAQGREVEGARLRDASRSAAGTSGSTTRRPTSSWSQPTATAPGAATCWRGRRSRRSRASAAADGEGSSDDLRARLGRPTAASVVFVGDHHPRRRGLLADDTHLLRGPGSPAASREALTSGPRRPTARPRFAPDGRSLCYPVSEEWGRLYALDRLACARLAVAPARPRRADRGFDRSVADFAFAPDGRSSTSRPRTPGFVQPLLGPGRRAAASTPVLDVARARSAALDVAGERRPRRRVRELGQRHQPAEIVRVDPAARRARPLTDVNTDKAAAPRLAAAAGVLVHERRGRRIHSFVAAAAGLRSRSKKYPLLVLIHGGPANMWRDSDHAALELPPARGARLRRAPDRLPRLDRLRRGVHARHPEGPPARVRRTTSTRPRTRPSSASRSSTPHARPRPARATAAISRTGWRPRPRATGA